MKILVINCGSSSIKFKLYGMPGKTELTAGVLERIGDTAAGLTYTAGGVKEQREVAIADHQAGIDLIIEILLHDGRIPLKDTEEITAVGHRVVHGAEKFTGSVILDDQVIDTIEASSYLAPLHNPPNLIGIRAARKALPHAVQAGCFDTAFHQTIPEHAYMYALPYEYYERHRFRRYGFHGSSHRYVAARAAVLLGKPPDTVNCITCHLGNGCSITAVRGGRSVDTSMGLTPLEGVVMGTRCGDIDPAIIFFIEEHCGLKIGEIDTLLNKQSGLLGLSGLSNDLRELQEAAGNGHDRARLALDVFVYRIRKYIGAYTAVLDTVDAVVFTGGIGENAVAVRDAVCTGMSGIGIRLDTAVNQAARGSETLISTADSPVAVYVIPTDEEGVIVEDTAALLAGR